MKDSDTIYAIKFEDGSIKFMDYLPSLTEIDALFCGKVEYIVTYVAEERIDIYERGTF